MKKIFYILAVFPYLLSGQVSENLSTNWQGLRTLGEGGAVVVIDTTNFYVRNGGSDDSSGNSSVAAWATIAKVNAATFAQGDSIFFRKGSTWREEVLTIPNSGNADSSIVFTNYGTGDDPKIYGSKLVNSWVNLSGNIWYFTTATANMKDPLGGIGTYYSNIFFVESDSVKWGSSDTASKTVVADLVEEYDWLYVTTVTNDTLYIYSPTDPNTRYPGGVEVPQIQDIVTVNSKEYIEFNGLEVRYGGSMGIRDAYPGSDLDGLTIRNCNVGFFGVKNSNAAYGLHVFHSNMLIEDNELHNCGRRNLSMNVDNATTITVLGDVIIQDNYFHTGFHTCGPDIANGSATAAYNGIIIRRNRITEGISTGDIAPGGTNGMYIAGESTGKVEDIDIYNNQLIYLKGKGIQWDDVDSLRIYNNTFYMFNQNVAANTAQLWAGGTNDTVWVKNNTFYKNINNNTPHFYMDAGAYTNTFMDYNLYFSDFPATNSWILIGGGGGFAQTDWAAYKAASGWDGNSPAPADPTFTDPPDNLRIQTGSPAIGAGIAIPGYTTDYEGVSVSNPPNTGAFETVED